MAGRYGIFFKACGLISKLEMDMLFVNSCNWLICAPFNHMVKQ